MRTDVIDTIKNTLEETKNIKILSLKVEDNILFGVYINEVREEISFLSQPKTHFETTIDNINLQFFELGALLYNIYFHGALKFIDILYPDDEIMKPNSYYINLCDLVVENLPFNIAKLNFINATNQNFDYENDVDKVSMLMELAMHLHVDLLTWKNINMDNFLYVRDIENKNDFIKACNAINTFKQWLQEQKFAKISEKNMNRINDMYVNLQILHMKV